jgi:pyruvate dehydrogenase E2 component (dihydrolipoamide acetyltransferase)
VHVKNRELPVTSLFERESTSAVAAVLLLAVPRTKQNLLKEGGAKVSVSDLLVRACAVALRMHPAANASWVVDEILRHRILV